MKIAMHSVSKQSWQFEVVGNDVEGWSIDAKSHRGEAIQLGGIYDTRQSAINEIPQLTNDWVDDCNRLRSLLPAFRYDVHESPDSIEPIWTLTAE